MRGWFLRLLGAGDLVAENTALRQLLTQAQSRISVQTITIDSLRNSERRYRRLFHQVTAQIDEED